MYTSILNVKVTIIIKYTYMYVNWLIFFILESCKNEDIRLQSITGQDNAGRVEVCVDGEWRLICQDNFEYTDASVVCNQLGFSPYGKTSSK